MLSLFDMEMIFYSHANETHLFKIVHLASFLKPGFLELGSGLLLRHLLILVFVLLSEPWLVRILST